MKASTAKFLDEVGTFCFVAFLLALFGFGAYSFLTFGFVNPFVIVQGHSMDPTYHEGQFLTVYKVDKKQPQIGDVLVYKPRDYHLVIHRIMEINNGSYVTKGDNNTFYDYEAKWMNGENASTDMVYGVVADDKFLSALTNPDVWDDALRRMCII